MPEDEIKPSSNDDFAGSNPVELGQRLKEARESLGLTQAAVAESLAMPRPSISEIEAGRRKVGVIELERLARLYRRPVDHFLGRSPSATGDEVVEALFRTTSALSGDDRKQVLRFAEFLRTAGPAKPVGDEDA